MASCICSAICEYSAVVGLPRPYGITETISSKYGIDSFSGSEDGPSPNVCCVGKKPISRRNGLSICGSAIIVTNSHAKSLCCDVLGIANSHPPIIVDVGIVWLGTGNIGINPISCSNIGQDSLGNSPGIQEPASITEKFLFVNAFSNSLSCGSTPASTCRFKNSIALSPSELLYDGNQYTPFVGWPSRSSSISPPSIQRYGYHISGSCGAFLR